MTLSAEQIAFLALHIKRTVLQWSWHMTDAQIRATTAHRTATIWRRDLDQMLGAGLMEQGAGFSVRATDAGRAWLADMEVSRPATLKLRETVA